MKMAKYRMVRRELSDELISYEYLLPFLKTRVWFPAPRLGSSQATCNCTCKEFDTLFRPLGIHPQAAFMITDTEMEINPQNEYRLSFSS